MAPAVKSRQKAARWVAAGSVFLLAIALGVGVAWSVRALPPQRFADSESYLFCARQPLGFDFFFSDRPPVVVGDRPALADGLYRNRPPLVPLVYRFAGLEPRRIVGAQILLYALGAGAGIALLVAALPVARGARLAAGAALGLLAASWNLAGWTRVLLTEAIVLALVWLLLGALAYAAARRSRPAWTLAAVAGTALALARDSGGLLAVALAALTALAAVRTRGDATRRLAALALVLAAAAGVASWGTLRGQRTELPLLNVLFQRIAPDDAALDWWRRAGLPWHEGLATLTGRFAFERDFALFRDPANAPLRAWFATHGRGRYVRFLVTHPAWTARTTARGADDLFGSDLATYVGEPPGGPARALWRAARALSAWPAAAILALAAVALVRRRGSHDALDRFPFVVAAAFVLHGLAVFHADAAETERHCFPTLVGLQIAAVLAATLATARRREAPTRAAA